MNNSTTRRFGKYAWTSLPIVQSCEIIALVRPPTLPFSFWWSARFGFDTQPIISIKVMLPFQRTFTIFVSYGNAGHTAAANNVYKTLEFNWLNQAFCPASAFVSADRNEARNPQRFIHATVIGNVRASPTDWQTKLDNAWHAGSWPDTADIFRSADSPTRRQTPRFGNSRQTERWNFKIFGDDEKWER